MNDLMQGHDQSFFFTSLIHIELETEFTATSDYLAEVSCCIKIGLINNIWVVRGFIEEKMMSTKKHIFLTFSLYKYSHNI